MNRAPLIGRTVVAAPMAGGPTTVDLVVAVSEAGGLGFLAGGYKGVTALRDEVAAVRARTSEPFGVNVFVPGRPADPRAVDRYLHALHDDAAALGVQLGPAEWDDDEWDAKVDLLLAAAPPVVSFTFGCPPPAVVEELERLGSVVVVTVTSPAEAEAAVAAGARWVCAQGTEAGAHRGSHTNVPESDEDWATLPLVCEIAGSSDVGIVAAGGITTAPAVDAALAAGARSVQAGTAFLLCDEAGTHPAHRAALRDPSARTTRVTRAFTGRPARAIANAFVERHREVPAAFPEIGNASAPIRAAAAAAGDTSRMSLWAGQAFRRATARPAGEVVDLLTPSHRP